MRWLLTYLRRHHLALVALFIALGGTSYAAFKLPRNSVGTAQLKKGAVVASKVKPHSLLASDFGSGQLPAGARGPEGPQGPQGNQGAPGTPGSARAYADITPGATPGFRVNKGFTSVTHPGTGEYCVTPGAGIDPSSSVAVVTPIWNSANASTPQYAYRLESTPNPCSSGQFTVITIAGSTQSDAEGFSITVP